MFRAALSLSLALCLPGLLLAQTSERVARLGILVSGSLEQRGDLDRALVEGLRARGYVEGRNIIVERRYDDHGMGAGGMGNDEMNDHGTTGRLPRLAQELADMKMDAIVTTCAPSTHAAKNATSSIPIIMASVSDPVGQGLITSLARPGRNITGLSSQANELLPKRLELIVGLLPPNAVVAVLENSRNPVHPPMWRTLDQTARKVNLRAMLISMDDGGGLVQAFEAAARAGAKAVYVLPDDPVAFNMRHRIVALANHHRMIGIYWASEFVEAGGLMSYGANLRDAYSATALYVDRILKGEQPSTLAVAQPTRFELVISQKAATALALKIPSSLLLRADRVIE